MTCWLYYRIFSAIIYFSALWLGIGTACNGIIFWKILFSLVLISCSLDSLGRKWIDQKCLPLYSVAHKTCFQFPYALPTRIWNLSMCPAQWCVASELHENALSDRVDRPVCNMVAVMHVPIAMSNYLLVLWHCMCQKDIKFSQRPSLANDLSYSTNHLA